MVLKIVCNRMKEMNGLRVPIYLPETICALSRV